MKCRTLELYIEQSMDYAHRIKSGFPPLSKCHISRISMLEDKTNISQIFAGIVTYNPDIDLLKKNLAAIKKQLEEVVIVDNYSDNVEDVRILANQYNCQIVENNKNRGIAAALNQIFRVGKKLGYKWVLTLDQDSECPEEFCNVLSRFFDVEDNVAVVAPVIVDRKNGIIGHNPAGEYQAVRTCITSGSCTRLSAWDVVGGCDEYLFIDSVDFDFCYRLRKAGYKIIQTNKTKLLHSIGDTYETSLLHIKYLEHSAFRYYYIARNNIYYPRKNELYLHVVRGFLRDIQIILHIILFEKDKINKIKRTVKGLVDGVRTWRSI